MTEKAFTRNVDSLAEVYGFTEDMLGKGGISDAVRFSVHLAIEELFVNLVEYNALGKKDIVVDVEIRNAGVAVTITDPDAVDFDVTKARDVDIGASLEERKPGGLGLHLIQHMVDTLEYDYRAGRSRIRFTKEAS